MNKIYIILALIFSLSFVSCTENFEEINSNPDKLYDVGIEYVFPGSVYKSIDCLADLNYNYFSWYARYASLTFTSPSDKRDNSSNFTDLYTGVLRDLKLMQNEYEGKDGFENRVQIVNTWQAYIYSIIVGSWGGMPMSHFMEESINQSYKYDGELDMYKNILTMLDSAVVTFNPNSQYKADFLPNDPIFPTSSTSTQSDIVKWRKFANSLRLDIALRIQNLDPQLAEEEVRKSMEHEDWLLASNADNVVAKWGVDLSNDVSYYYNRILKTYATNPNVNTYPRINHFFFLYMNSYKDPRISSFASPTDLANQYLVKDTITRVNQQDATLRDSIAVTYKIPYFPVYEGTTLPEGWQVGIDPNSPGGTGLYDNPFSGIQTATWSLINLNYLKMDASLSIMRYAEVSFMKAEAKLKYGVGSSSAEQYYNNGIDASFEEYGYTTAQATQYKNRNGIKWNTNGFGYIDYEGMYKADINGQGDDSNHLEQIYKQWYIADFFNGFAGWMLERRTRVLNYPPFFYANYSDVEGSNGVADYMPERLVYPIDEMSKNPTEYYNAIATLQASSPAPNTARYGDNFYTLLGIGKLTTRNISQFQSGVVKYNTMFLQKWYGNTLEDLLTNSKAVYPQITDTVKLKTYLGYTSKQLKTYTPN